MRRVVVNLCILGALLCGALSLPAQTVAKRDSAVADSLVRLRPYLNGWRLTSLNRQIITLRVPGKADTVVRVDTVKIVRVDTVRVPVDTGHGPPPPPPPDTVVPPPPPPPPPPPDTSRPPTDTTRAPSIATRAALPALTPNLTPPPATRSYRIGADLQLALDTARAGDRLLLSGTYTGNFVLPPCRGGWITVTTAAALPADGTRIRPADSALLPRIQSPNTSPALRTVAGACKVWLRGLDVYGQLETTASLAYGILALGTDGDGGQITLASVPTDILVSQSWIHGAPQHNDTRCVVLNSANTVIRDSWISECHARGADSQAIEGWNGPGPYLIENNYLEGAGENVMFGGADPGIPGLVPSDITIRRNHIAKPLAWKGGPWSVKNLFELKSAQRVLVESNVIENVWPAGQEGMAIVIKSNANGCQCSFEGTRDLTFRWNVVRNNAVALNIQGYDDSYGWTGFTHTQRITVEWNLFAGTGAQGGRCAHMLLTHDDADLLISHNTFVHGGCNGLLASMAYAGGTARRLEFSDNVATATATYALFYDGGIVHAAALGAFAGATWSFQRNVVGNVATEYVGMNPSTSWYPASLGLSADFSFPPGSPWIGRGWNGSTPGADISELARRTAGVVVAP